MKKLEAGLPSKAGAGAPAIVAAKGASPDPGPPGPAPRIGASLDVGSRPAPCVGLAILLAALAVAGTACTSVSSKSRHNQDSPTPVEVVPVEQRTITRTVEAVGTLWPDDQVVVSAQVEGQVQKIFVDVGDAVREGQVMVSLNKEELLYAKEQREANLHKTMAQLGLQDEQGQVQDQTALPEVKRAAADLFDAEQKYRRARSLFDQKLLPQQDRDSAEARYRSAQATYETVLQGMQTLQAQLRSEKAELALARKKLGDADIRAPFSGFVQERQVSPGQYLRVQSPVMTLVKPDPLKLRADVPEKMAHWVQVGQPVETTTEALPNRKFNGTIRRITPAVKEQSRSFSIEAIISNQDHLLKPGVFVKATVTTSEKDSVLLIPEATLSYAFGVYRAFVVENGRLSGREVKLGDQAGKKLEVTDGLKAGELVAFHPERLREGMAVRVEKKP